VERLGASRGTLRRGIPSPRGCEFAHEPTDKYPRAAFRNTDCRRGISVFFRRARNVLVSADSSVWLLFGQRRHGLAIVVVSAVFHHNAGGKSDPWSKAVIESARCDLHRHFQPITQRPLPHKKSAERNSAVHQPLGAPSPGQTKRTSAEPSLVHGITADALTADSSCISSSRFRSNRTASATTILHGLAQQMKPPLLYGCAPG